MDYKPNDEGQKKLCIRHAFNTNLHPAVALLHTQNSHPSATFAEVLELYELFRTVNQQKNDSTDNQTEPTSSDSSSSAEKVKLDHECSSDSLQQEGEKALFEKLPVDLLNEIIVNSSTQDQNVLHRTNHGLSSFISSNFSTFEEIAVMLSETTIQMKITEQKSLAGIGKKRKLDAENDESGDLRSPADISDAIQILKPIFTLPNIKIGILTIRYEISDTIEPRIKEFLTGFQKMLDGLKSPVHVEALDIAIEDPDSLLAILNKLKPGPLTKIELLGCNISPYEVFNMEQIVGSEHWQYFKYITSGMCILNIPLSDLVNVATVSANIIEHTIEDILSYKNKLLESSKKLYHMLYFNVPVGLIEAFKPFEADQDITIQGGTHLDINGKQLHFELGTHIIEFKRS